MGLFTTEKALKKLGASCGEKAISPFAQVEC